MNKNFKTIIFSIIILTCVICMPAYSIGKKSSTSETERIKRNPRNSRLWLYTDDTKAYEKEKTAIRYQQHYYKNIYQGTDSENNSSDLIFISPFRNYGKFHDPDGVVGINFIKRPPKDFE